MTQNRVGHIRLTSHPEPGSSAGRLPIRWGTATPAERGPVVATVTLPSDRNVIGAHGGLIDFESEPGRTVLRVLLPIETETVGG